MQNYPVGNGLKGEFMDTCMQSRVGVDYMQM